MTFFAIWLNFAFLYYKSRRKTREQINEQSIVGLRHVLHRPKWRKTVINFVFSTAKPGHMAAVLAFG